MTLVASLLFYIFKITKQPPRLRLSTDNGDNVGDDDNVTAVLKAPRASTRQPSYARTTAVFNHGHPLTRDRLWSHTYGDEHVKKKTSAIDSLMRPAELIIQVTCYTHTFRRRAITPARRRFVHNDAIVAQNFALPRKPRSITGRCRNRAHH